MASEIQRLRELRSANEQLMFALSVGINGDIAEIRTLCDKYLPKDELEYEKIELCADKIKTQVKKFRELKSTNAQIAKDLGE